MITARRDHARKIILTIVGDEVIRGEDVNGIHPRVIDANSDLEKKTSDVVPNGPGGATLAGDPGCGLRIL